MLKLLFFLLLSFALFGEDKIEIYASKMLSKAQTVEASGGVSVVYKNYLITADSSLYNRKSGELELFGHIHVNNGVKYKVLGKYARLNIAKKEKFFKPFYMTDKRTDLWMSAKDAETKDALFDIHSGTLSGCNPFHPKWKMEFSSLDYDSDAKWMNMYNTRLYLGDLPIFYTPYFGYSTDTTRATGLLMPALGISSSEGMYYAQPIYIAEQNWWDIELTPQLRTTRGKGVYQTFRFVDSAVSKGELTTGYFKEDKSYFKKYELKNQAHYGFNFKYDNSDFINSWFSTNFKGQSGLYADVSYMNDVDYINLSKNNVIDTTTATQVLSRINTFYNNENQYIGSYFKYYQNLTYTPQEQKQLLQKIPTLQYHYYLDTFLDNHLLYNMDVQTNNSARLDGKRAIQTDVTLPITLQTSFLDEYLNLSYTADFYFQHSSFSGSDKTVLPGESTSTSLKLKDGYYARNTHSISLSTQLTKGYETVSHVISFGIKYKQPGEEIKNGYYKNNESCQLASNTAECEFYNISSVHKEAQLEFIQYIYGADSSQILYHRMSQSIAFGEINQSYSELENELNYKVTSYLNFYNNMFYNYHEKRLSKALNKMKINVDGASMSLSHLYQDNFQKSDTKEQRYVNYMTSNLSYVYNRHYSFNALYNYDIQKNILKSRGVGFLYKSKCLDLGVKYQENRRPVTINSGNSFINDRFVFLSIVLKPIMQKSGESLLTYKLPN